MENGPEAWICRERGCARWVLSVRVPFMRDSVVVAVVVVHVAFEVLEQSQRWATSETAGLPPKMRALTPWKAPSEPSARSKTILLLQRLEEISGRRQTSCAISSPAYLCVCANTPRHGRHRGREARNRAADAGRADQERSRKHCELASDGCGAKKKQRESRERAR